MALVCATNVSMFPRAVRMPPRSQALCGVTPGHTFPAGVARPLLQSKMSLSGAKYNVRLWVQIKDKFILETC